MYPEHEYDRIRRGSGRFDGGLVAVASFLLLAAACLGGWLLMRPAG